MAMLAALGPLLTLLTLMTGGCQGRRSAPAVPPPQQVVIWRAIGSWSGHGNLQTESFPSDTGTLRVRWQTSAPAGSAPAAGAGTFRLTAHSAISGRPLEQVVESHGSGSGVGYVNQEPHVFYLVIESDHLSWNVSVEEGIAGQVGTQSGH